MCIAIGLSWWIRYTPFPSRSFLASRLPFKNHVSDIYMTKKKFFLRRDLLRSGLWSTVDTQHNITINLNENFCMNFLYELWRSKDLLEIVSQNFLHKLCFLNRYEWCSLAPIDLFGLQRQAIRRRWARGMSERTVWKYRVGTKLQLLGSRHDCWIEAVILENIALTTKNYCLLLCFTDISNILFPFSRSQGIFLVDKSSGKRLS